MGKKLGKKLGKKWIGIGIVIVAVIVVIVGYLLLTGGLGKPEIKNVSHQWGTVTPNSTEIRSTVIVHNPNPVGINVESIEFGVYADGLNLASGSASDIHLGSNKDSEINVGTTLYHNKIPDLWYSHLNRGEHSTFKIEGEIKVDLEVTIWTHPFKQEVEVSTSILAGLNTEEDVTYTFGPSVPYPMPVELTLESLTSTWGTITPESTEIRHEVVIYNDEPYSIPITKIRAVTEFNGIEMAVTETYSPAFLIANSDTQVPFKTTLSNSKLADWWPTHIDRGESTEIKTTVYAVIEAREPVGTKEFKLVELTTHFETDLLGG